MGSSPIIFHGQPRRKKPQTRPTKGACRRLFHCYSLLVLRGEILVKLIPRERHQSHVQRIVQSRRVEIHDRLHILYLKRYDYIISPQLLNFTSRGAPANNCPVLSQGSAFGLKNIEKSNDYPQSSNCSVITCMTVASLKIFQNLIQNLSSMLLFRYFL